MGKELSQSFDRAGGVLGGGNDDINAKVSPVRLAAFKVDLGMVQGGGNADVSSGDFGSGEGGVIAFFLRVCELASAKKACEGNSSSNGYVEFLELRWGQGRTSIGQGGEDRGDCDNGYLWDRTTFALLTLRLEAACAFDHTTKVAAVGIEHCIWHHTIDMISPESRMVGEGCIRLYCRVIWGSQKSVSEPVSDRGGRCRPRL